MIGKIFGKLTVKEFSRIDKNGNKLWKCECLCSPGVLLEEEFKTGILNAKRQTCCKKCRMMPKYKDLTGFKKNRITIISLSHKDKNGKYYWFYECSCNPGTIVEKPAYGSHITSGRHTSCGCSLYNYFYKVLTIGYIYIIKNKINDRYYIGMTNYLDKRIYEHFRLLQLNKHENQRLQDDFLEENYEVYILHQFDYEKVKILRNELPKLEKEFIKNHKPFYNIKDSGDTIMEEQKYIDFSKLRRRIL